MNELHLTADSIPPIFQFASSPAVLGAAISALSRERAMYFEPTLQGLVLLRREDVLAALRDPARYSNRCYGTGPLVWSPISMDGAQHMRVRRPYGPFFSPAAAQHYEESVVLPVIRELVASLTPADASGPGGPGLDLLADFAAHIPLRVLTRLFGLPPDAIPEIAGWTRRLSTWMLTPYLPEVVAAGQQAASEIRVFLQPYIERAQRSSEPSLFGELIRGISGSESGAATEGVTLEECQAIAISLLMAGNDTVRFMLAGALAALLLHPPALSRVCAEPQRQAAALEECLRWGNTVPFVLRQLTSDTVIAGTTLPAGTLMALSMVGFHYDPAVYPHPEVFDIDRRPNHSAFGVGPHHCVGAPLARVEARAGLSAILERFPRMRLDPARPPRFAYGTNGATMYGPDSVHVLLD